MRPTGDWRDHTLLIKHQMSIAMDRFLNQVTRILYPVIQGDGTVARVSDHPDRPRMQAGLDTFPEPVVQVRQQLPH